jgi:hypothetical protein
MTLKKGDTVLYRDPLDNTRLHHDVVESTDKKDGRTVVVLKSGQWCRLNDIIELNNGMPPVEWAWS